VDSVADGCKREMIPYLDPKAQLPRLYHAFLDELPERGFAGEIRTDYATRLVAATDNSVYQIVPHAVVFPKTEDDVAIVLALAHEERFANVKLSPRGGGTGTNGQSLCDGIIIDVSRHLARILETNLAEGWVRVQPGVVLDALNAQLKPHGVFFAPNLSPSSRATIGGMISTDASGKGSRVYGKTSQHVLALRAVLMDGTVLDAKPIERTELEREKRRKDLTGSIFRTVDDVVTTHAEVIATTLPKIARFLTGYDLAHVWRSVDGPAKPGVAKPDERFDLTSVLCGSEGTLALVTEATLRLTKLPAHRTLVAIRYPDFDAALRAANVLVRSDPGAIETIDDTIVDLAKKDVIWHAVSHLVEQAPNEAPLAAVNLVEFESDDRAVVASKVEALTRALDEAAKAGGRAGYTVVRDPKDIAALWTLRKKGVGLLGNVSGDRRPVPFVEDTAVPPERLADYIREFRAILDRHGLRYGMFGHVDVGCLHVRPALDMRDEHDERLLRTISDEVVALVRRYGGVLWGEHGKGFRGEYTPIFFGPELYEQLRRIKGAFDPRNQLNPGKLATPPRTTEPLISIDTIKRGKYDRQIHQVVRRKFDVAVHCNGNGACFDWNPDTVMCPSFLVTKDRIHSPKGRAGIMREWLRLLGRAGHDAGASRTEDTAIETTAIGTGLFRSRASEPGDFSHEVYDAMNGCLACKACATDCPIKVDVPSFRADFLAQYHGRYRRPLKDYFVAALETSLVVMAWFPILVNRLMQTAFVKRLLERTIGIVDTPLLAESSLASGLRARRAAKFDTAMLGALDAKERARTVLVAQDAFTTFYEPNVALAAYDVLEKLGRRVVFLPYFENGKGLHIKGFLRRFANLASKNAKVLREAASLGIPIVGLEPAVTLTYRDEYVHALGKEAARFEVLLLQEYLAQPAQLAELKETATRSRSGVTALRLFGHCTERTAAPKSQRQWQSVFKALGVDLDLVALGCCGMCGVYGHETEHLETSRRAFALSWEKALSSSSDEAARSARSSVLVTGHSCRSQVKRFGGFVARHPVEALHDLLAEVTPERRRSKKAPTTSLEGT
jgi:(R)-2-hydroxyglutarate dehydrogenase